MTDWLLARPNLALLPAGDRPRPKIRTKKPSSFGCMAIVSACRSLTAWIMSDVSNKLFVARDRAALVLLPSAIVAIFSGAQALMLRHTPIVIAYRLATIVNADVIHAVAGGRVVKSRPIASSYQLQFAGAPAEPQSAERVPERGFGGGR
jgi:hypothetical protein